MPEQLRILVIEDDPSLQELTVDLMEMEGFAVRTASDGAEALAALDAWMPSLVLLDLQMPRMDGWEFLAAYRQRPAIRAPIIVFTALPPTPALKERVLAAGAVDLLPKPFDLDHLLALMREHLPVQTADREFPA